MTYCDSHLQHNVIFQGVMRFIADTARDPIGAALETVSDEFIDLIRTS